MNPRSPRGDAVVQARLYGHEQIIPSLCPSSGSAFPGAESSGATSALGCHHLLTVLSADPLSSCRLSHSSASLLPPREGWKWLRGGKGEKPLPAVFLLHLPGYPHGVQVPPVPPPRGPADVAPGAQLTCTPRLAQRVVPAVFYSLLRQECAWDKLPRRI